MKSVSILHSYQRLVGKSNVRGFHIYRMARSSMETQKPNLQFIFMNFIGCLCICNVFITSSFFYFYFFPWFYPISSSLNSASMFLSKSMIIILPDFYSLTATKGESQPSCGMKSQVNGENDSLSTDRRSMLSKSNILSVLSIPTVQSVSSFLDKADPVMSPECALQFFLNSTRWKTFSQNLMCPSMLKVMMRSLLVEVMMLLTTSLCMQLISQLSAVGRVERRRSWKSSFLSLRGLGPMKSSSSGYYFFILQEKCYRNKG